ncbi:MAG: ATP-binding protein [Egibacteraceae bacterium]
MDREGAAQKVLLTLTLQLPRDSRFVGLLRHVATCVFEDVGAPQEAADDIRLALSEACANAVRHAVGSNAYSVVFTIDTAGCTIDVLDLGPGFAFPSAGPDDAVPDADTETGRGVMLMRALVDDLQFAREDDGTTVTLRKSWPDAGVSLTMEPSNQTP